MLPSKQSSFLNDPGTVLMADKRKSTLKMTGGSIERTLELSPGLRMQATSPRLKPESARDGKLARVEENNLVMNDGSNTEDQNREDELLADSPDKPEYERLSKPALGTGAGRVSIFTNNPHQRSEGRKEEAPVVPRETGVSSRNTLDNIVSASAEEQFSRAPIAS